MRALFLASTKLGGDHPPLLAVARGLNERGHAVTLLGDADLEPAASEIGLPVLASDERYDISVAYREARTAAEGLSPAELGERNCVLGGTEQHRPHAAVLRIRSSLASHIRVGRPAVGPPVCMRAVRV